MTSPGPALSLVPSPAPGRPSCSWCARRLQPIEVHRGAVYCGRKCRQAAFRLRELAAEHGVVLVPAAEPRRMLYLDPPYPGLARRYYQRESTYAGEVDHPALIAQVEARRARGELAGWALSTSARALRDLLPLCPPEARACSWVKPIGTPAATLGIHNTWEPLIVVQGRRHRGGRRDWLEAQPARFGGHLPGRKPLAFVAWMFGLLGLQPGDELEDAFPGTGIVGRAWAELQRPLPRGVSDTTAPARAASDASPAPAPTDTSRPGRRQLPLLARAPAGDTAPTAQGANP